MWGKYTRAYAVNVTSYVQKGNRAEAECGWTLFETRLHHLPQYPHEIRILQCCCHTLLVCQLFVDFFRLAVCILLNLNLDSITWR
jgi:hypothetical protein